MVTENQILLVKSSWSFIVMNPVAAGQLFYERLFEVAPGVRHLFKGDIKHQARKLINMVTLVVTKIDKLDDIIEEVKLLGQRHNRYGAEPAHYQVVGECLLWTLEKGLGDKWNEETRDAWTKIYGILADAMIRNQSEAAAA